MNRITNSKLPKNKKKGNILSFLDNIEMLEKEHERIKKEIASGKKCKYVVRQIVGLINQINDVLRNNNETRREALHKLIKEIRGNKKFRNDLNSVIKDT